MQLYGVASKLCETPNVCLSRRLLIINLTKITINGELSVLNLIQTNNGEY